MNSSPPPKKMIKEGFDPASFRHRRRHYQTVFFMSPIRRWVSPVMAQLEFLSHRGSSYRRITVIWIMIWKSTWLYFAMDCLHTCACCCAFVWYAKAITVLEWLAGSGWWMVSWLVWCVSVYAYLPPPDQQPDAHGEQHDQGGHGHDDDDHHRALFAGCQRHWKRKTLVTHRNKNTHFTWSTGSPSPRDNAIQRAGMQRTYTQLLYIKCEQEQEMRNNNKAMTLKADLISQEVG